MSPPYSPSSPSEPSDEDNDDVKDSKDIVLFAKSQPSTNTDVIVIDSDDDVDFSRHVAIAVEEGNVKENEDAPNGFVVDEVMSVEGMDDLEGLTVGDIMEVGGRKRTGGR